LAKRSKVGTRLYAKTQMSRTGFEAWRAHDLEHDPETGAGATVGRPASDIALAEPHASFIRLEEARDAVDERRFTAAVRPDQTCQRTRLQRERDVVHGKRGPEASRDGIDGEGRRRTLCHSGRF
jgi:hypothetical protein